MISILQQLRRSVGIVESADAFQRAIAEVLLSAASKEVALPEGNETTRGHDDVIEHIDAESRADFNQFRSERQILR